MRLLGGIEPGPAFLALALSAGIWYVITTEQNPER